MKDRSISKATKKGMIRTTQNLFMMSHATTNKMCKKNEIFRTIANEPILKAKINERSINQQSDKKRAWLKQHKTYSCPEWARRNWNRRATEQMPEMSFIVLEHEKKKLSQCVALRLAAKGKDHNNDLKTDFAIVWMVHHVEDVFDLRFRVVNPCSKYRFNVIIITC